MSIVSKAQLKADFLDGKIITEDKMDDLIDSTYNPNLVAGTDITLVPSGNDITINSTGGGGAGTLQDVLTAGSIGTVPTLIEIISTGVNNVRIEAGNVLNLWGLIDVDINASGGDTTVGAQDNVFITTAAIAGTINLASGDIVLDVQGELTIPLVDGATAPIVGQVLAAKNVTGDMEWITPGGGGGNTIYTADDAILGVRDVTLPALQNLTFTSPASGNAVLLVGDQIAGNGGIFALGDNASPANETSVTIGKDSSTGGDSSIAIGDQAQAGMGGNNTIAIGFSASTGVPNGENAIAIGNTAQVNMTSGASAIAIGSNSSADNGSGIAIGQTAQSHADNVVVIGSSAEGGAGGGDGGIAIGDSSQVNSNAGDSAIAIGNSAVADQVNCIAVGTGAVAGRGIGGGENSIAIGEGSQANQTNGDYGIALGTNAQADESESIGIGVGAVAAAQGNISIGFNAGAAQTATETLTVLIGDTAGQTLSGTSNSNVVIGSGAFSAATVSSENTIIGAGAAAALAAALPATGNTVVGMGALNSAEGGSGNVAIGFTALGQIGQFASNPTFNTGVGTGAGLYLGLGSDWNVSIGNQAGPSDTAATPRPQEGTVAIGAFAGDGVTTGGNNLVDNSIYIGNRTTMAALDINTLSAFAIGGGRDAGNHSKLLMYGQFEDVVDGGTTDARLKINPGTGQDNVYAGGTAVLPDATLQVVNDGSGTTDAFKIDRGPSGTGVEGAIFNVDNTGAVTIGDQDAGTEYTLPIADGAADEVLTTDGAGNITFKGGVSQSQYISGTAVNVGDVSTTNIKQVIFTDPVSGMSTNAGCWIVPRDITITDITIKWVGSLGPGIGAGVTQELTWDLGILTSVNDTADTNNGGTNFAASGVGLTDISIGGAGHPGGDASGTFFYRNATGISYDVDEGEILVMLHALAGIADWTGASVAAMDVSVTIKYDPR